MRGKTKRGVAGQPFKYAVILNYVADDKLCTGSTLANLVVPEKNENPKLHRRIRRSFSRFINYHLDGNNPDGYVKVPGIKGTVPAWFPNSLKEHIEPSDLLLPVLGLEIKDLPKRMKWVEQEPQNRKILGKDSGKGFHASDSIFRTLKRKNRTSSSEMPGENKKYRLKTAKWVLIFCAFGVLGIAGKNTLDLFFNTDHSFTPQIKPVSSDKVSYSGGSGIALEGPRSDFQKKGYAEITWSLKTEREIIDMVALPQVILSTAVLSKWQKKRPKPFFTALNEPKSLPVYLINQRCSDLFPGEFN